MSSTHETRAQLQHTVDFFDLDLPTISDSAFSQSAFWLAPPSPPIDENRSPFFWERPPDTQAAEQNTLAFLSVTPDVSSTYTQSSAVLSDDIARNYDLGHENVTREDVVSVGNTYFPIAVPTMPPVRFI